MAMELSVRLMRARHDAFVGRSRERALFRAALSDAGSPLSVIYVFGPGGIGKTALLGEFAYDCLERDIPVAYVDARHIEPSPESFLDSLRSSMRLDPRDSPIEFLSSCSNPYVLCIDTYEMMAPLDPWLLENFLPQLPEKVVTVVAGREPPSTAWRSDPGWQTLVHLLPLRNLTRRGRPQQAAPLRRWEDCRRRGRIKRPSREMPLPLRPSVCLLQAFRRCAQGASSPWPGAR